MEEPEPPKRLLPSPCPSCIPCIIWPRLEFPPKSEFNPPDEIGQLAWMYVLPVYRKQAVVLLLPPKRLLKNPPELEDAHGSSWSMPPGVR